MQMIIAFGFLTPPTVLYLCQCFGVTYCLQLQRDMIYLDECWNKGGIYMSGVYRKCLGNLFCHSLWSAKSICRFCGKLEGVWPITEHGVALKMAAVYSSEISKQAKDSVQCENAKGDRYFHYICHTAGEYFKMVLNCRQHWGSVVDVSAVTWRHCK